MGDGGKGSAPRPLGITLEDFDKAWEAIFKKKEKESKPETEKICCNGDCNEGRDCPLRSQK